VSDDLKYGVNIGRKKGCGGLFADDVALIASSAKKFRKIILKKTKKKVHKWVNLNEMTFGIEKWATMVIKPMNFQFPPKKKKNYSDSTFYLGMNTTPKVFSYIYLGIPFFRWSLIGTHLYDRSFSFIKIFFPVFYLLW